MLNHKRITVEPCELLQARLAAHTVGLSSSVLAGHEDKMKPEAGLTWSPELLRHVFVALGSSFRSCQATIRRVASYCPSQLQCRGSPPSALLAWVEALIVQLGSGPAPAPAPGDVPPAASSRSCVGTRSASSGGKETRESNGMG